LNVKPSNRWQVLIGKWLGFAGMLTVYLALMVGGIALVMYLQTGYKAHHLLRGFALIWLETLLLLTLTFLFGTSFSTLTNGVLALGLHGLAFLGGWIEQFGSLANSQRAVDVGIVASILMPSEVLWRRAAFEMQSPLANAFNISPFSAGAVPSVAMIVYAGIYVATSLGLALWLFRKRDL
jgi:ABC-type transport system involved in multi-copper enzyme maturation permease subunit